MAAQVAAGHGVSYFFSGRSYPYLRGPRLRRWTRAQVSMLEVVNSPLHDHGRQPELELSEPRVEGMFTRVIEEQTPDVVHVQELAGLPSSLLDLARRAGVPTVITLQDYFLLCPTFKLIDATGKTCLRREIGVDCVAATAANPSDPGLMFDATLRHDLPRLPVVRRLGRARRDAAVVRISRRLADRSSGVTPPPGGGGEGAAAAFQRRRDVNVERLNRTDRVIAMSHRVAEIHSQLGVDAERLRVLELTLSHIERLRPRRADGRGPLTFATLGGFESTPKGARLLLDAMALHRRACEDGALRLLVFGHVDPAVFEKARRQPGIELQRPFTPDELDDMLDPVDVGLMPSIWEEAYGYAGMEFLAKAIPVIANEIGGMVDYTRPGETGWLNRSCTAEELAGIMGQLVENPAQVATLNEKLRSNRGSIVKPMAHHAEEMDAVYGELIAAHAA